MKNLSTLKRQKDRWLVGEFVNGNDEAFEVLADRYLNRLNAVVCSALFRYAGRVSAERRERLVCDALVKAALNIAKCRRPDLFGRWLMRVAVNVVVDDCRRVGRSREFSYSQLRVSEAAPTIISTARIRIIRKVVFSIFSAVPSGPPAWRRIFGRWSRDCPKSREMWF